MWDINRFIQHIENIVGSECFNDSDDSENYKLFFGDYQEIGIEINKSFDTFSIFVSYPYDDVPDKNSDEYITEISIVKRTYLEEQSLILFLSSRTDKYSISTWDDGCYVCPGVVMYIGFYDIPYDDEAVILFSELLKEYYEKLGGKSNLELIKYIAAVIGKKHDYLIIDEDHILLNHDTDLFFTKQRHICDENVQQRYRGKEYYLFMSNSLCYAAHNCEIDIFLEIFDKCRLYDELTYSIEKDKLYIVSDYMILSTPCYCDSKIYSKVEEMTLLIQLDKFLPFASSKLQRAFSAVYPEIMNDGSMLPIIITEGHTDWKHLEKHWGFLKKEFPYIQFKFWKYDSSYNMGSSVLLEMCKSFSKFDTGRKYIFIFDCDEDKIISQVKGKGDCSYKDWGNGVFSFPLPIPEHRKGKSICIEHLYTDDEIKTSFMCTDGIKRRLYLGCDFDIYGRNIEEGLLCTNCKLCGESSNKIIDGTSNCRVVSMTSSDTINYALSKSEFADKIVVNPFSKSYNAFEEVFKIIFLILNDRDL